MAKSHPSLAKLGESLCLAICGPHHSLSHPISLSPGKKAAPQQNCTTATVGRRDVPEQVATAAVLCVVIVASRARRRLLRAVPSLAHRRRCQRRPQPRPPPPSVPSGVLTGRGRGRERGGER
uniref:Uncharacterized protein n=1 Tax=Oryza sativa subsp. japonica TaxID=39947 RepID=Q7EZ39_ORYSJ|nr:hypothetical protein [Oryza sativa Japonica Group]